MLRNASIDDSFFHQGRSRTGLHTGTARDTFRIHKRIVLAGHDYRVKASPFNGQRKGALHFGTGAHATRADNAFTGIKTEIRVGAIGCRIQMIFTVKTVAHFAQTHRASHILQFAVAIGWTGQAIQRMVGDIQLHNITAQFRQLAGLGGNGHAFCYRCGTGCRITTATLDLYRAQATRTKGFKVIRGA